MSKPVPLHVVPHENGWAARREGGERVSVVAPTKEEVFERARDIAQREGGSVVIHGKDGTIQEERTYGHDPYPPRG